MYLALFLIHTIMFCTCNIFVHVLYGCMHVCLCTVCFLFVQVNYLIDEACDTGKGGNTVANFLHHLFATHGLGETCVHLHTNNCMGQNKNNYRNSLIFRSLKFCFKNFLCEKCSSIFRFLLFCEEKFLDEKFSSRVLNFSMMKKSRFTVCDQGTCIVKLNKEKIKDFNYLLKQYLLLRVLVGLHKEIILSFLPVGHTKFSPDWCFGLLKQKF